MSKVCTMKSCKTKKGMCIHEKMMMSMVAMGAMFAVYYFAF